MRVMNSRRLMGRALARKPPYHIVVVQHSKFDPPKTGLGQTRSFGTVASMSGFRESGQYMSQLTADRLHIVNATPIPREVAPPTIRRSEMVQQNGHRIIRAVCG